MCMSLLRNETNRMITHKVTMSQEAYNKLQTLHYSNVGLGDEPFFWTGGGKGEGRGGGGLVCGWESGGHFSEASISSLGIVVHFQRLNACALKRDTPVLVRAHHVELQLLCIIQPNRTIYLFENIRGLLSV